MCPPPHTHIPTYSVQPQPMLYCIHYISDMARAHAMNTVREKDWMTVKWLRMVFILIGQGHLQKANSSLCWSWHAYGAVYVCIRMYVCTCVCIYTYVYLYVCVCVFVTALSSWSHSCLTVVVKAGWCCRSGTQLPFSPRAISQLSWPVQVPPHTAGVHNAALLPFHPTAVEQSTCKVL